MSLTKKHFLKIAEIVSRLTYISNAFSPKAKKIMETEKLIEALSEFFYSENKNFQANKFKEACYKS